MSENTAGERVILCDASSPQSGTDRPYFIGYGDMVDGYRHAWTETSRSGRKTLRHGRDFGHPADPRCPECHPGRRGRERAAERVTVRKTTRTV